jgi:hypothetical protein
MLIVDWVCRCICWWGLPGVSDTISYHQIAYEKRWDVDSGRVASAMATCMRVILILLLYAS